MKVGVTWRLPATPGGTALMFTIEAGRVVAKSVKGTSLGPTRALTRPPTCCPKASNAPTLVTSGFRTVSSAALVVWTSADSLAIASTRGRLAAAPTVIAIERPSTAALPRRRPSWCQARATIDSGLTARRGGKLRSTLTYLWPPSLSTFLAATPDRDSCLGQRRRGRGPDRWNTTPDGPVRSRVSRCGAAHLGRPRGRPPLAPAP